MDLKVLNFISDTIEKKKPRLKQLTELVGKKFQVEPSAADLSFVKEQYRFHLMRHWTVEFVESFNVKNNTGEITDDEVVELLETSRGLKAFDETPLKLQGPFYNLIKLEKEIFISKDFVKPRREIFNVLTNKIMSFGERTWNEYQLFNSLIEVFRNSYKRFDDVVAKLNLQSFVNGNISFYQVSQNILAHDFSIGKYDLLKELSSKIENKTSFIQNALQREIGKFLEKLVSKEIKIGGKKVWLLQRKVMTSKDLNANFGLNIEEIHVVCNILHIDQNLPSKYRGKNVILVSNTVRLHQKSIWDISGLDAPKIYSSNAGQYSNGDGKNGVNGEAGGSGGNCEIFSMEINNAKFWTIKSNGGNGLDGQDGGNGENGISGNDIVEKDFTINNRKISSSNFLELLSNYGISTEIGSRCCHFFENNLRKQIVFNRDESKSELIMLIKGSAGTTGALGGFGGVSGHGGFAGKINVTSDDKGFKIIARDGLDGTNGKNGFIGLKGREGRDAYIKIKSYKSQPEYGGLNKKSKFEFSLSDRERTFSVFYRPLAKYFFVEEVKTIQDSQALIRNSPQQHGLALAKDDEQFYEILVLVIKNSNKELKNVIKNFKVQDFLTQRINFSQFASAIVRYNFQIPYYNILKVYAKLFTIRLSKLEIQIRNFLRDFIADTKVTEKFGKIVEIKNKLLTSEDLNGILKNFNELHVVCDTLHVNSNLSELKFRGKNLGIYASTINIHKSVELILSGCDDFLAIKANCSENKCIENGGHCIIDCNVINNPSLLKVISNGGNASQARDGVNAQMESLNINGKSVDALSYSLNKIFQEGELIKHLVKESPSNYLLLVKGSNAIPGYNNLGEKGGLPGYAEIRALGNLKHDEVEVICKNGNSDDSQDGKDVVLYVRNGHKQYIGTNDRKRFNMLSSNQYRENAVKFSSQFYYPKISRLISEQIKPDRVGGALYNNIIWVLRNSYSKYYDFVTKWGLQKFVDGEISLTNVARNIEPTFKKVDCLQNQISNLSNFSSTINDQNIANFTDLKNSAKSFMRSEQESLIRDKIRDFIKSVDIEVFSNTLTAKKKIYSSSELNSLNITSNVKEIYIICDTLHIDSELPQSFRGKNLAIYANYVQIHKNVRWNLSGEQVYGGFSSDAGQTPDGEGRDGTDGTAGNSGGNFSIHCKLIENSSALTVESNGSDGTDGQNGGNGKDGENGDDASQSKFKRKLLDWRMYSSLGNKSKMYEAFDLESSNSSHILLDDGFSASTYVQIAVVDDWGLMLVKGKRGTPGKAGGLAGYGGQGGFPGKIIIETTDNSHNIRISSQSGGSNGRQGKGGFSGKNGRNGEDVWLYDKRNWSKPEVYGGGERRKFRLTWRNESESKSVKDGSNYVYVVDDGSVHISNIRQQNNSKLTRQREYKALAKQSASINMNAIMNKNSKYLSDSKLDERKITQTQVPSRINEIKELRTSVIELMNIHKKYLQTSSYKVLNDFELRQESAKESIKKSDIQTESTIERYHSYLNVSTNDMEEMVTKYSDLNLEIEQEDIQVQTQITVQLKFDPKKAQKIIKVLDSDLISYDDFLQKLKNGSEARKLMKMIQNSRFEGEKYKYLADNIGLYRTEKTARKILDKRTVLDESVEKYVKLFGKSSKNSVVLGFHDLQIKNDPKWKKCTKDQQVLQNFLKLVADTHPVFVLDFLKNLVEGSMFESTDLAKICEEKYLLIFFKEVYSKMINEDQKIEQSVASFGSNSGVFLDQISFFRDTKDFLSDLEPLNRHFKQEGDDLKKEILDYFLLNMKNFNTSLPEAVFKILVDHADELEDIKDILNDYFTKASDLIYDSETEEDESDDGESNKNTTKSDDANIKENYTNILVQFFTNMKIVEFIKNDINLLGVNSILYRNILAHKYSIRFTILVKSFGGDLKIAETHNFGYNLEFQYENIHSVPPTEITILLKNGKFSLLDFDNVKYEAYKAKLKLEVQSESILKVLRGQLVNDKEKTEVMRYLDQNGKNYLMRNLTSTSHDIPPAINQLQTNVHEYLKNIFEFQRNIHENIQRNLGEFATNFSRFSTNVPQISTNVPRFSTNFPSFSTDFPSFSTDFSSFTTDFPSFSTDFPSFPTNFPSFQTNSQQVSTDPPRWYKNKLLSIFSNDKHLVNNTTIADIILSNFPYILLRYDENGVTKYTTDDDLDKIIAELKKDSLDNENIVKYKLHNDQKIREDIKLDLLSMASISGSSIIQAIAIRLFNDKNLQTLQEFSLVLKTILDLLNQKSFHTFLTILILGNEQELWSLEFALLKLESIFGIFDKELKKKWRLNASKIKVRKILELFLEKVCDLENANDDLDKSKLHQVMDNMQYFGASNYENLKNSSLSSWRLMTTDKFWEQELSKLNLGSTKIAALKQKFEDLSSKFGTNAKEFLQILQSKQRELPEIDLVKMLGDFSSGKFKLNDKSKEILKTKPAKEWMKELQKHFNTEGGIRSTSEIIRLVEMDQETSKSIKNKIKDIGRQAQEVFTLKSTTMGKRFIDFTEPEVLEWRNQTTKSSNHATVVESLAIIVRMFQLKKNITLRDTQLMSILTVWGSNNGVLLQVSTGEGKTFIGVSLAILKVLNGEKVDIITSSSVLAIRDAETNKDFFQFFGISVDHNCHEDTERRKQAYGSQIVYGVLGNFQRDYLLTEFFGENFMSGHHFTNVLVDEVDSMLLDKGNNILYLSSSLPDIDEVESVFLFIWHYVNQRSNDPEEAEALLHSGVARKIILDNAFGLLEETDLKNMKQGIKSDEIMNKLKNSGIIDEECIICDETYLESRFDSTLRGFDVEAIEKIKAFCRNKIESQKPIKIPKYLKKFVLLHLNQWIQSAVRAMFLRNEKEYIVDRSKTAGQVFSDPNIIILDLDTGTDMTNSQWDEGLHQFLQLKHGCRLSLLSLKSIFISNVTYFKKYYKLYGMTGTLGNIEERKKTTEIHKIDFVTLPRYIEQRFQEYPPILEKDPSKWIKKIHDEVVNRFNENRSVLVICETIRDTKDIKKSLINNTSKFSESNVHVYQRDAADFKLGKLNPLHVIVATNLAGRGTDIKLSKPLNEAGGIHVILTYFPQNARIENQAFGRASRAGDMGSARLIICTDSVEVNDIAELKETRNHNELQRLDEVNSFYQNFITIEENFFGKFHVAFRELKQVGIKKNFGEQVIEVLTDIGNAFTGSENKKEPARIYISDKFINSYKGFNESKGTDAIQIYLDNFKLQWSFWLDENSKKLEKRREKKHKVDDIKRELENNFNKFLATAPEIHPVKQIELFKLHSDNGEIDNAKTALMNNFRDDSIAFQYLKCYAIIKRNQVDNNFNNRSLTIDEKRELIKCIKMLNNRVHNRNVRIHIANAIRDQYQDSLVSVAAFEQQQKDLNEIDEIFIDSIQSILGRPITPATLVTTEIKLDILTKNLHQELITRNAITPSRISSYYTDDDIRNVALRTNLRFDDLKKYIVDNSNREILSIKDFGEKLKSAIKVPSREEFWDNLEKKGVLTDQVEYAVIDLNVLKNTDPSIYNELVNTKTYETETLTASAVSKKTEIFFTNINSVNEDKGQFIIPLKIFESKVSIQRLDFLLSNDAIQINKRANFSLQRYESLKNGKIFDNFDEIKREDFKQICKKYENIFEKLTKVYENNRKILTQRGNSFALNYDSIDLIDPSSSEAILGDDEVYQKNISDLINTKFAYRIALENLAAKIAENVENGESSVNLLIHLEVSPHLNVINQLITNNIIEFSQAEKEKLANVKKTKIMLNEDRFLARALGFSSHGFQKTATEDFWKQNLRNALNDLENLEKKIKDSLQALLNEEIENPDIILKPLKESLTKPEHHQILDFMKVKGFDIVMKIELKKYTLIYWFRFAMVMLIAITQIVIGAILMVMSKGVFYKVGEAFIQEGVGDAIFALGTLKSGYFTWKDYGMHKLYSVVATVAFFGASYGLSKIKFMKKFFKESTKINQYLLESLKDKTTTVWQLLKSGGNVSKKEIFKLFAKTVASNVCKAITQAAIGVGADFVMEAFLNETTKRISEFIVNELQHNFWIHDLKKTIESLLQYYSPVDLKEKFFKEFTTISDAQQLWTDIAEKVSDRIDELIRTGQGFSNAMKVTTGLVSIVTKILEMSSVTIFALNIFNHLNGQFSETLKNKSNQDQVGNNLNADEIKKFQQEILDHIKKESTEKFKNAINSTAIKPALSFAATAVVSIAKQSVKGLIDKRKEKGLAKETAGIIESSKDGKIAEPNMEKINKILKSSKNPEIHAALTKLDVPINYIGIKAAVIALQRKLGSFYKIEINFEGKDYEFGDVNETNAKTVQLRLRKGHFENSNNSEFGNDCFYNALIDQIPVLKKVLSPTEFRHEVSDIIRNDKKIAAEIRNPKKRYFMNLGFYGGSENRILLNAEIEDETVITSNRRQKLIYVINVGYVNYFNHAGNSLTFVFGSYYAIKTRVKNREETVEIDHSPAISVLTNAYNTYGFTRKNTPAIMFPKLLHRMFIDTGNSDDANKFRNDQIVAIKNNRFPDALGMKIHNILETSVAFLTIVHSNDDERVNMVIRNRDSSNNGESLRKEIEDIKIRFPLVNEPLIFMKDLKNTLEEYINHLATTGYGKYNRILMNWEESARLKNELALWY